MDVGQTGIAVCVRCYKVGNPLKGLAVGAGGGGVIKDTRGPLDEAA